MNSVLIDNWTLHNATYTLQGPFKDQFELDALENLLIAILLWDKIYFWENGITSWWKDESPIIYELPSMEGVILPPDLELRVNSLLCGDAGTNTITKAAQQYQLIAETYGIDYLPKRERYEWLRSRNFYHPKNAVWPKVSLEMVETSVQEYYQDLMALMKDIKLQFRFPLLLDYIRNQPEFMGDYIVTALHMRETAPFCDMRSWIDELHNYIDAGNWIEVKHYVKNVEDIVSKINSPLVKSMEFQISVPPAINVNVPLNRLQGCHKAQLTFLHDLISFATKGRPEV